MHVIIPSLFTFQDSQGAKALLSPGENGSKKYTVNFSRIGVDTDSSDSVISKLTSSSIPDFLSGIFTKCKNCTLCLCYEM